MQSPAQESAMTEVALALAMGFFSLMVLTLISMGVESDRAENLPDKMARVLDLAATKTAPKTAIQTAGEEDILLIFDGRHFRHPDLSSADIKAVTDTANEKGQRIILAVDPALPFDAALAARERLPVSNLVVSPYSKDWKIALL